LLLAATATPVGAAAPQAPIVAAAASQKHAERLVMLQKNAAKKKSFWTKLWNSIK
jgi:hypothetical protein